MRGIGNSFDYAKGEGKALDYGKVRNRNIPFNLNLNQNKYSGQDFDSYRNAYVWCKFLSHDFFFVYLFIPCKFRDLETGLGLENKNDAVKNYS